MPQTKLGTLGKEQEVSNEYSLTNILSNFEQLMYNDMEELIKAARSGEIGYFDGTLADSRGNKVKYKNPQGAMEFYAGQGGLDKLGEILSGERYSFMSDEEKENTYNEIMGVQEETVETVSPQTARPMTQGAQGAQGLKDGFDGTDNNELYLTDGQRKAILSGSATVDMTDNQLEAIGRNTGKAASKFNLSALINTMVGKGADALGGIGELLAEAKEAQKQNKMVGEEVLTEGTTYDFDIDGNPTTFSFTETEEMSNKNGGIMKFAPGGNPHLDMSEEAAFEAFSSKPSPSPSNYNTGPSNPFNDENNTINTSPSSSTTNQNNQTQYNQIVDSAGTGNVNMEEIVDFREKSGMDGAEYSAFLDKIKERSGNEAFYDAGFVKGPGQMITNFIKSGGFLGNILKTVLEGGKDAGVMALDKAGDIKNYLSNFGDGVMANQAIEEFSEVQGPLTGDNKFRENLAMGDPLNLFEQYNYYGDKYKNPYRTEQGSYDDNVYTPFYGGRSPTDEMFASNFTMNPSNPDSFPMSRQYNQMFKDNMLSDGGGLFPQMTPQDPLMNSFNKTPLSVLERDNGGVTRQQYMQQYAPKTAAQMLGIVDTYDEEGIMGV